MLTVVVVNSMKGGWFTGYINDRAKQLSPGVRVAFPGAVKKKTERRNFYVEGRWSVPGSGHAATLRVSWTAPGIHTVGASLTPRLGRAWLGR